MALDASTRRSRRAVLTAAAGAAAATVVSAARPLSAMAAGDDGANIQVGHLYSDVQSQTTLGNQANDGIVLWVASNNDSGHGAGTAVVGHSHSGIGVNGQSVNGTGVNCTSDAGYGVYAASYSNVGAWGQSHDSIGVYGSSALSTALAGVSYSMSRPATVGQSHGGHTGVAGCSGVNEPPIYPIKTGVYGWANQNASAVGVMGESKVGRGGVFKGGKAQVRLVPSTATTHPASGTLGDLFLDKNTRLWFCKGGATWKQIA